MMRLLNRLNSSTSVFSGFGVVLLLLLLIAAVSLFKAGRSFRSDRGLAHQTDAEGRVQASMLITRLYAKDSVLSANAANSERIFEKDAWSHEQIVGLIQKLAANPMRSPDES